MGGAVISKPEKEGKTFIPLKSCLVVKTSWLVVQAAGAEEVGAMMVSSLKTLHLYLKSIMIKYLVLVLLLKCFLQIFVVIL